VLLNSFRFGGLLICSFFGLSRVSRLAYCLSLSAGSVLLSLSWVLISLSRSLSFSFFFRLLFSLVTLPRRHFLLDTFAENASNGSLSIRLARSFPTRVSSLLSAGFFFPSRRLTFDKMS
jgi:hypothetical protein